MHKAINAKFKKGDRVIYVATGERGVVKSNYAPYEYAVRFDGHRLDSWVAEEKLRAANCAVANAKFKKGDNVYWDYTHGVVKGDDGCGRYLVRFDNYLEDVWVIEKLLRTTRFKKGDKVYWDGVRGIITKDIGCGKYAVRFDGYTKDLCIRGDKLSWMPVAVKWGTDARFSNCSTANSVVAKAVANARAANSSAEPTVAKNGAADVLVSFTTVTAKGLEKVQARMTESDFDVWAKKVGAGDTQNVYKELATSGKAGFAITRPLPVSVTQL